MKVAMLIPRDRFLSKLLGNLFMKCYECSEWLTLMVRHIYSSSITSLGQFINVLRDLQSAIEIWSAGNALKDG